VPSLHVGGTVLFVLFMWPRVNKWWKSLLAIYPFAMMFSLAYGAEHFVADGIAGALCAWLVHWLAGRGERWVKGRNRADTLDVPPDSDQESACPPTATMPSST
jgi:membrane-associated phospholipid phosphatase